MLEFFNTLSEITSMTLDAVNFVIGIFKTIFELISIFFDSMPSFISTGFILVFIASLIIIVVRFVRG